MHDSNAQLDADLLGYLVGGLDESEQRDVETQLDAHPESRQRLDELRLALEPLKSDRDDTPPPRDLAVRTLAVIAEHCCRELPHAPIHVKQRLAHSDRSWWRRVDVLVAACILLTFLGLGIPGILKFRGRAARIECQNNLREFSTALHAYHDTHRHFPNIAEKHPHDVAGMVIPILADAGVLSDMASVRCPGNGAPLANTITLEAALAMPPDELPDQAAKITACYTYSLGYKDENGYHPPGHCDDRPAGLVALMSDCPPPGDIGNSPNHGGYGQNVLFIDGSVRFLTSRAIGTDDIFTNRAGQVAAGLDCLDIVLGSSSARP
jgi:hypothetical protein